MRDFGNLRGFADRGVRIQSRMHDHYSGLIGLRTDLGDGAISSSDDELSPARKSRTRARSFDEGRPGVTFHT
jgi:hypothetical protein